MKVEVVCFTLGIPLLIIISKLKKETILGMRLEGGKKEQRKGFIMRGRRAAHHAGSGDNSCISQEVGKLDSLGIPLQGCDGLQGGGAGAGRWIQFTICGES